MFADDRRPRGAPLRAPMLALALFAAGTSALSAPAPLRPNVRSTNVPAPHAAEPAANPTSSSRRSHLINNFLSAATPAAGMLAVKGELERRRVRDSLSLEKSTSMLARLAGRDEQLKRSPLKITSRLKTAKSCDRKMGEKRALHLDELRDVVGVRVVVASEGEEGTALCYRVLHELAREEGEDNVSDVKDYIRGPKPNGYQSLHATVQPRDPLLPRYEIQIRTSAMDHAATHDLYHDSRP